MTIATFPSNSSALIGRTESSSQPRLPAARFPTRNCRAISNACWEADGVDADLLDPVLLDLRDRRRAQKVKYGGELFVADWPAEPGGKRFIDFFQRDR